MATFTSVASGNWSDVDTWRTVSAWAATTNYAAGNFVKPLAAENGYVYEVTTDAGSSGGSEPAWPVVIGNTVVDDGITWTCRAGVPQDNDTVVVSANNTVTVDVDMAAAHTGSGAHTTGINGLTITGHASTPGMLAFKADADGTYRLRMKDATNIAGAGGALTCGGRLMMGGGTWGSPAAPGAGRKQIIEFLGTTAGKIDAELSGSLLAGQLICDDPTNTFVETYGTPYIVTSNQAAKADKLTFAAVPSATPPIVGTPVVFQGTDLPAGITAGTTYWIKAITDTSDVTLSASCTGEVPGGLLDITDDGTGTHYCQYGGAWKCTQATGVNTTTGVLTFNGIVPVNGTVVRIKSSTTLPTGLSADAIYYVVERGTTPNLHTCKLAVQSGGTVVIPSEVGTGTLTMYVGGASTNIKMLNVIQDVSAEAGWSTTAEYNRVVLANIASSNMDVQFDTLATINAWSVVLTTNNVDSAQNPLARIYPASRNVQILSNSTSTTQPIIDLTSFTASAANNWSIACGIIAKAVSWAAAVSTTRYCWGLSAGTSVPGTAVVTMSGGVIAGCTNAWSAGSFHNMSGGTIIGCTNGFSAGTFYTMSDGTISGCGQGPASTTSFTMSGGTITGCTNAISSCTSFTMSGGTVSSCSQGMSGAISSTMSGGTIIGCGTAWSSTLSSTMSGGTISGCYSGFYQTNVVLYAGVGVTLFRNTFDIRRPRGMTCYGLTITSVIKVSDHLQQGESLNNPLAGVTVYDYIDTPGYIGRWDVGGTTISAAWVAGTHDADAQLNALYGAASPPTCVHVTTCQDSDAEHWCDIPIWGAKGQNVTVDIYARCANATDFGTAGDSRPYFYLLDGADLSTLDSGQLADNDDWQKFSLNSGALAAERQLILRMKAKGGNTGGTGADMAYWFQVVNLDYPAVADVESGVVYGNTVYTGTLAAGGEGDIHSIFSSFIN